MRIITGFVDHFRRIDYQIATPGAAARARKASIYVKEVFSDHAPLVIDYEHSL